MIKPTVFPRMGAGAHYTMPHPQFPALLPQSESQESGGFILDYPINQRSSSSAPVVFVEADGGPDGVR